MPQTQLRLKIIQILNTVGVKHNLHLNIKQHVTRQSIYIFRDHNHPT